MKDEKFAETIGKVEQNVNDCEIIMARMNALVNNLVADFNEFKKSYESHGGKL